MNNLPERGSGDLERRSFIQLTQAKPCYGDLCVTRKSWNRAFISSLFDAKVAIFPVVHAAAAKEAPKKPPPMRYKDLPVTECNEFYEYRTYLDEKQKAKCPDKDVKLLQTFLCPIVHKYRIALSESIFGMTNELGLMRKEACDAACKNIRCFKKFMRHPDNLLIRRVVVVLGTLTGIYIGSGTRGITKKLFFGTLGALAAGALCFPKETDVIFRNVTYNVVSILICLYNCTCGKEFSMRKQLPCKGDLPPPPPDRKTEQINKKCEEERKKALAKAEADAKAAAEARAAAEAKALAEAKAAEAAAAAAAAARAAARKKDRCRDE